MKTPALKLRFEAKLIPCPEGGFTAFCPQIKGAISEGETEEEALENLVDAIQGVIEVNAEMAEDYFSAANSEVPGSARNYHLSLCEA